MKRSVSIIYLLSLLSCNTDKVLNTGLNLSDITSKIKNHNMVVSPHPAATKIGVEILKQGGNAVDAAVAVSFALAVLRPQSTGLGGGGFALVGKEKNKIKAYDFRETAPAKAHAAMYTGIEDATLKHSLKTKPSLNGYLAAATPGFVAGWLKIHREHGSLPLKQLLLPSVSAARNGFVIYASLAQAISYRADTLSMFPASKEIFLPKGTILQAGDSLKQNDLATTINGIANDGEKYFYQNQIAKKIAEDMKDHGGLLSLKDIKNYRVKLRTVIQGTYKNHTIVTMPPPSAGGIIILQALKIFEAVEAKIIAQHKQDLTEAQRVHLLVAALKRACTTRNKELGDPDFTKINNTFLLSDQYMKSLTESVDPKKAIAAHTLLKELKNLRSHESHDTAHISVIDKDGLAISSTHTINGPLGSALVIKDTGIIMNNQMDDFTTNPGKPNLYGLIDGAANVIQSKKRMLSSMSPTFVFKPNGKLWFILGAAGGSKIISACINVIINMIDDKMNIVSAVDKGRIHHQWLPDEVVYEKNAITEKSLELIGKLGHVSKEAKRPIGIVQAIQIDENRGVIGAADKRTEGLALGY